MSNQMKVWPGPRVLVPMATDILLIGTPDIPKAENSGIEMSSTKTNYFEIFLKGEASASPFDPLIVPVKEFKTGAHIMWTLPHALRQGHQVNTDGNTNTEFPDVPNRWLITRMEYASTDKGTPPKVVSSIVKSEVLSTAGFPAGFDESLFPKKSSESPFPVSRIGQSMDLSDWDGKGQSAENTANIKAAGPGVPAWSVLYDNIQNVFSFVDQTLSDLATPTNSYTYTYSIVGWYQDPDQDIVKTLVGDDPDVWEANMKENLQWIFSKEEENTIDTAIVAWQAWQKAHGLDGVFDPAKLELPAQEKAAIVAWHSYWQTNGQSDVSGNLAKQLLCHSVVGSVVWKGHSNPYGSGNPLLENPVNDMRVPELTIGSTAVDAISTYISQQIVKQGTGNSEADIPVIARALSAFQKDLLDEYGIDPIRVENQLHASSFSRIEAGSQWIVTRLESNTDPKKPKPPTKFAGRQSIPLNEDLTNALTALNTSQFQLNNYQLHLNTLRGELFRLLYKQTVIDNVPNPVSVGPKINEAVVQSIKAVSTAIDTKANAASDLEASIKTQQQALAASLVDPNEIPEVDQPGYELKRVDLTGYSAPIDPVVAIAGAQLDHKFSPSTIDNSDRYLCVRYTGQAIKAFTVPAYLDKPAVQITPEMLLTEVDFPLWNIFPKEVFGLWSEALFLDTAMASVMAVLFFKANGVPENVYNTPTGSDRKTPLENLTVIIQTRQTSVWSNTDTLEYTAQAVAEAVGYLGMLPAKAGVAFRTKQPWTPVYMDWAVNWFPTSPNAENPFKGWSLKEIDYMTSNTDINPDGGIYLEGRTLLNPNVAFQIQERLYPLEGENLDDFPDWMQEGLRWASREAGSFDLLTQSLSGFNEQLITKLVAATAFMNSDIAEGSSQAALMEKAANVISEVYESYIPKLGDSQCDQVKPEKQQYAPIRSGFIKLVDLQVIDAFGQVMPAKPSINEHKPDYINVLWSESFYLSLDKQVDTQGRINPRILQSSKVNLELLKGDTTEPILTNSSDATSPICGWVMANHLDNSLMVYDASGVNLGAVIKVQSEAENLKDNWTIRWDAAPGLDHPLGAPPDIDNDYLAGFINGLLRTGFEGAEAYENLMQAIDSTLWTMGTYSRQQTSNLSLLVGRPLAVVRGQVSIDIAGSPIYKQYWCNTGEFYNDNGNFNPTDPPYMSISMPLRVGDAYLATNGVMGYFPNNDFNTFYPVYGAEGQTKGLMELLRAGTDLNFNPPTFDNGYSSSYIRKDPVLIETSLGAKTPVPMTMLVDPTGDISVFSGLLPSVSTRLPQGPVNEALTAMTAAFRVGPLLLPPDQVQMPTPSEVKGNWGWIARKDTTSWTPESGVKNRVQLGDLYSNPLRLKEGWLTLSNENKKTEK